MDLQSLKGQTIIRIRRIYYLHQDQVETRQGALELGFQDSSFLLIDTKSDWTLQIVPRAWKDPFFPPVSPENSAYLRAHGQWSIFDLSGYLPASRFSGQTLSALRESRDASGQLMGVILQSGAWSIQAYSYAGEIRIAWQGPDFACCDLPRIPPSRQEQRSGKHSPR